MNKRWKLTSEKGWEGHFVHFHQRTPRPCLPYLPPSLPPMKSEGFHTDDIYLYLIWQRVKKVYKVAKKRKLSNASSTLNTCRLL